MRHWYQLHTIDASVMLVLCFSIRLLLFILMWRIIGIHQQRQRPLITHSYYITSTYISHYYMDQSCTGCTVVGVCVTHTMVHKLIVIRRMLRKGMIKWIKHCYRISSKLQLQVRSSSFGLLLIVPLTYLTSCGSRFGSYESRPSYNMTNIITLVIGHS